LANTWGYDVVNIAGDGSCFFSINKHSKCSLKCKCLGNRGNTDCKKNAKTTEERKEITSRSSRKRGKHQIDTTPNKYLKLSPSKNDELNKFKYFITVAIVSFFVSEGLETSPDNYKQMTEMFNNIIKNDSRRRESDVSASRNTF
jgi:hypothetical protein